MNNLFALVALAIPLTFQAASAHEDNRTVDLLQTTEEWTHLSLYENMAFTQLPAQKEGETTMLGTRSTANPYAIGAWSRPVNGLKKGNQYVFEAKFHNRGLVDTVQQVCAILLKNGREFHELVPVDLPEQKDWRQLELSLLALDDYENVELRLYLSNAVDQEVLWKDVKLTRLDHPRPPRNVRLGAISGRPDKPENQQAAIDFYLERLHEAGKMGMDIVCLPENINIDLVPGKRTELAEPVPGNTTRLLGEVARKHNMWVVAGLSELASGRLYNTAVLIDRQGNLAGRYRKTHLTLTENLVYGIIPGDSYPVFDTDFGKIGLLVCYDNHFPEVSRILAVKGAEILFMPNASDGREDGSLWEPYMKTRALDNHIYFVSGVNYGKSIIVSPNGDILDINKRYTYEPGDIVRAEVQLGETVANWSGESIGKRYHQLRRPKTYGELTYPVWIHPDVMTPEQDAWKRSAEINNSIENASTLTADSPLPDPSATVKVSSQEELEKAIAEAVAGSEIVIREKTILGALTIDRSFPCEQPLVIRAESVGSAMVSEPWQLSGSGIILKGLTWDQLHGRLQITGSDIRITRCAFTNTGNPETGSDQVIEIFADKGETSERVRVDRCEISHFYQDAITVRPEGEIRDVTIDHNHIHHQFGSGKHASNGIGIYVGTTRDHRNKWVGAIVAYNLIHNMDNSAQLRLKTSGNYVLFNQLNGFMENITKMGTRSGRDNVLAGNRVVGFGSIRSRDYNNILLGNEAETIRVYAGNIKYDHGFTRQRPETGYSTKQASRNALLVGNKGQIQLGFEFDDTLLSEEQERVPARNTVIYEHDGDVNLIQRNGFDWAGSWRDLRTSPGPEFLTIPEPVSLTTADVGPGTAQ